MIFENIKDNRVILSARKCGLMTLSTLITTEWKNHSSSTKHQLGNPDPISPKVPPYKKREIPFTENYKSRLVYPNEVPHQDNIPWDKSFWKNKDVILIIREPYDRYVSGMCQLTRTHGLDIHNMDMDNLSHNDGHTANWLDTIQDIEYKTLSILQTENLTQWLVANNYKPLQVNPTDSVTKLNVLEALKPYNDRIMQYLEPEYKVYNKLLDNNQEMQYN